VRKSAKSGRKFEIFTLFLRVRWALPARQITNSVKASYQKIGFKTPSLQDGFDIFREATLFVVYYNQR
jgi:hypothetical protein